MHDEFLLLNPGPVPVSRAARDAMAEPMVSHRSPAFEEVYRRVRDGLEYVFTRSTLEGARTASNGMPLILNGTATLAMEAAIANLAEPETKVVSLVNGKFGRRFARIADRYATTETIDVEWGRSFDLEAVNSAARDADIVTMVHNETSTGVLNPVGAVGELVHETGGYFIVDGVTSIGGDEFHIDDWAVDVVITDAQKALAAPPGLSALYAADRAIEAFDGDRAPFYGDLDWHVRKAADKQTPFTSAVPLFRALAIAVEDIVEEGMANRIRRHRRQAAAFRAGFKALGLELFPNVEHPSDYSNTVTAVALPPGIRGESAAFFDAVADQNVSISGGQAHLSGDIFRVSNMGVLSDEDILRGVRAVGHGLVETGVEVPVEAGSEAALDRLDNR